MESKKCTLALFRWKGGDIEVVKLPLCAAKVGDVVELVDRNRLVQILETVDVVDGGEVYNAISTSRTIYTATAWFSEGWRRGQNDS